jgi:hypothetical protein
VVSSTARRLLRRRLAVTATSQVSIVRGTPGELDRVTGLVSGMTNLVTIYSGPARIHLLAPAGDAQPGGPVVLRTAQVSIPMSAAMPRRDDLLTVSAAGVDADGSQSDVNLDGRTFSVRDVDGGGLFGAVRKLTCTGWFPSRTWQGAT